MNKMSSIVDQNQHRRVKSREFLFMTAPSLEDKDELYGISTGSQIKKFKEIFHKMKDIEVYKVFRKYIKTKKMDIQILKEPQEHWKKVDKSYTEENGLIGIFSVENKFPCMDMYYTEDINGLKEDLKKFLETYKEN